MSWDPRYERHYRLPGFGKEAQEKLAAAKVLVVGAGGLGCPVLQYLTASGVGYIGVLDFDTIALSNLQRQTLYQTAHVGALKSRIAVQQLRTQNPDITVVEHAVMLDKSNARAILTGYDIIVDCTDNFAVRYVLNDSCVLLAKPLVFAAVYQYEGQVAVFNVADEQGIACNYRDLFPEMPRADEAPNCAVNGVLGVLPGIIGMMQATEVIKLITGVGEPLVNKLMTFNVLNYRTLIMTIAHNPNLKIVDPAATADAADLAAAQQPTHELTEIQAPDIETYLQDPEVCLLDVRESDEEPRFPIAHQGIPLSVLHERMDELTASHIIVVCQSGIRSIQAARQLQGYFGSSRRVSHLAGGIVRYLNHKKAE